MLIHNSAINMILTDHFNTVLIGQRKGYIKSNYTEKYNFYFLNNIYKLGRDGYFLNQ